MLVWICRFPLPLSVWEGLRFVIVTLPGFSLSCFHICRFYCHYLSIIPDSFGACEKLRFVIMIFLNDWPFCLLCSFCLFCFNLWSCIVSYAKKVQTAYFVSTLLLGSYYRKCYTCVTKTERGYCFQEFWRLEQGISEPEFYGDLVYRFRKIVGKSNFSEQFRKLIDRYKRIGHSLDIMRQTACLVINPIIVAGYASLFICTTVVRASDPMKASS